MKTSQKWGVEKGIENISDKQKTILDLIGKNPGISKEQIAELMALKKQKKLTTVLLKEGIPFVPSFLLGFIAALLSYQIGF